MQPVCVPAIPPARLCLPGPQGGPAALRSAYAVRVFGEQEKRRDTRYGWYDFGGKESLARV